MCGEKWLGLIDVYGVMGSPPHVRGKVQIPEYIGGQRRITPACAGKSVFDVVIYALHEDHPRMCGEKTKKIP